MRVGAGAHYPKAEAPLPRSKAPASEGGRYIAGGETSNWLAIP